MSLRSSSIPALDWAPALLEGGVHVDVPTVGTTSPRSHRDRLDPQLHLIWFVIGGSVKVTSDKVAHTARAGTGFWVPPGRRHTEEPRPGSRVFYLRFLATGGAIEHDVYEDLVATRVAWHLRWYLDELHRAVRFAQELQAPQVRALLVCLLIEIVRNNVHAADDPPPLSDQQLEAVLTHMRTHMGETLTPRDLARQVGLSLAYFSPLFKRTVGLTPRRWILEQRMLAAADLLGEGPVTMAEVAAAVGCPDANLFGRQFRAVHGVSPGAYQRGSRRRTMP